MSEEQTALHEDEASVSCPGGCDAQLVRRVVFKSGTNIRHVKSFVEAGTVEKEAVSVTYLCPLCGYTERRS